MKSRQKNKKRDGQKTRDLFGRKLCAWTHSSMHRKVIGLDICFLWRWKCGSVLLYLCVCVGFGSCLLERD
ncbi:hypothetical protein K457DRAFT_589182 [Linnemannia elongata AG-77]|uniref:Uncharacterized protein n=1 Tax=Linnemannia elongata AG-77 TaxID=1314771 RepID=A0A197JSN5_9FUNG|nr:hypothetical protein K457DRAFT_589182 [Linnemannia elongata AG-77]